MAEDPLDPSVSPSPAPEPQAGSTGAGASGSAAGGSPPPGGVTPEPDAGPLEIPKEQRTWAMVAHLAGLAGVLPVVPLVGCVIGPLVVWLLKKDEMPFVDDQGKEALNFQLTLLIAHLVLGGVVTLLWWTLIVPCIAVPIWIAIAGVQLVLTIIAAIQANDGRRYRYPLALRLV